MRYVAAIFIVCATVLELARPAPPSPPIARPSLKELVAVRRLEAHDAAVRRNAAARRACADSHAARETTLRPLYSAERATPGPAFDADSPSPFPILTDEPVGDAIDSTAIVADATRTCSDSEDPEVFCPFRCTYEPNDACSDLNARLYRAWGGDADSTWLDASREVRASVRVHWGRCELRFQRYVPGRRWIAMTASAQVPLALLGQPVARLPAYAQSTWQTDEQYDARYTWPLAVTGVHVLRAELSAFTRDGRIARFDVTGDIDEDGGGDELHELVERLRGGPVQIELDTNRQSFELAAQRAPTH
ncbi:MAG TPA: hypothetical protein VGL61_06180 [Kofleriaceae bacterium]